MASRCLGYNLRRSAQGGELLLCILHHEFDEFTKREIRVADLILPEFLELYPTGAPIEKCIPLSDIRKYEKSAEEFLVAAESFRGRRSVRALNRVPRLSQRLSRRLIQHGQQAERSTFEPVG